MVARNGVAASATRRGSPWHSTARPGIPLAARLLVTAGRLVTALTGRLDVSGSMPESLRGRPFLLAANHIGVFDTAVLLAACHRIGVAPRFVTNGGLFDTPLIGGLLHRAGHLRVDPLTAGCAVRGTALLPQLGSGGPVLIYPEGRISGDPDLWPDRGQTGLARLALATGLPVLPLSQWGAHEVIPAGTPAVRSLPGLAHLTMVWLRAVHLRRQVRFQVHVGPLVDLTGLHPGRPGDAMRAHSKIMIAITEGLVPLRADQPCTPRYSDPTRPQGRPSPWHPPRDLAASPDPPPNTPPTKLNRRAAP
ncbi:MAG: 1-acyl-sn-glycerol-3-phosphate acyltransferase [Actinomycetota bacterium]|nr:1-acyl-sn-glycerol-3-phosphate acyltransferase [Actinomycetota bacterium]